MIFLLRCFFVAAAAGYGGALSGVRCSYWQFLIHHIQYIHFLSGDLLQKLCLLVACFVLYGIQYDRRYFLFFLFLSDLLCCTDILFVIVVACTCIDSLHDLQIHWIVLYVRFKKNILVVLNRQRNMAMCVCSLYVFSFLFLYCNCPLWIEMNGKTTKSGNQY